MTMSVPMAEAPVWVHPVFEQAKDLTFVKRLSLACSCISVWYSQGCKIG